MCQNEQGTWELLGIIALGVEDCQRGVQSPTVYTNVALYNDWIRRNTHVEHVMFKPGGGGYAHVPAQPMQYGSLPTIFQQPPGYATIPQSQPVGGGDKSSGLDQMQAALASAQPYPFPHETGGAGQQQQGVAQQSGGDGAGFYNFAQQPASNSAPYQFVSGRTAGKDFRGDG